MPDVDHVILTFSVGAILAPFSYYMGLASKSLKLPQITGYLVAGIICGPYVVGIMSKESVHQLNYIESACLSIIGLAAGAELDWQQLSKSRRQVLGITFAICASSWIFCYAAFRTFDSSFPELPDMDSRHLVAVSTLGATLMMTRSPASAIAVLKEVDAKGPFSTLVMAVTVVKDVVVIVAFALNMEIIRAVILPIGVASSNSILALIIPLVSIALSMAVGAAGGLLLSLLLALRLGRVGTEHSSTSIDSTSSRWRMVWILLCSTAMFHVTDHFGAEPLLSCVSMGMVMVNRRHGEKEKEELHHKLAYILGMTNVAFFGLVGASLRISALGDMFGASLAVAAVRGVSIYLGSWAGCHASGTTAEHRKLFWASMVTQAGVAMGLARLAGARFPSWGPHFQTFMTSIVLINLFVGPPLFRWSLIQAKEARNVSVTSTSTLLPLLLPASTSSGGVKSPLSPKSSGPPTEEV